jgi:hypothetical protein
MQEAEDEPLFAERVAGIDIAKAEVMVTVRVPSDTRPGGRQQETRSFPTMRTGLLALADWLRCWGVTKAGMEATGDYWKPVYFLLEREGFDCDLYHAGQVKALPGRPKTDKLDSVWLAKITERGSLPSSFVPPEPVRRLRTWHPVPAAPDPGPHRREAAGGETAGGRAPEAVIGDLRHPRGLRPGHAGGDHRRGTQPDSPGAAGPPPHAPQDQRAGTGPGLLLRQRRARLRPGDDARRHRPPDRPDR